MKPGKVLCCRFLLAILGVYPAQNLWPYAPPKERRGWVSEWVHETWQNTIGGYVCSCYWPIATLQICNSCRVYECKTKDVHDRRTSNFHLGFFVCCFDVYRVSQPVPSINYDLYCLFLWFLSWGDDLLEV